MPRFSVGLVLGLITAVVCGIVFAPAAVFARSYEYSSIQILAQIHEDTTVDVRELQTLSFTGEYRGMQRRISLKDISAITDIRVVDAITGERLERVDDRLDPYADPNSDGKYTVYRDSGEVVIEWYHNSRDTERRWAVSYIAHGAIGFYDDFDELYWNLFTDYDVPVKESVIAVGLPEAVHPNEIRSSLYKTPPSIESTKQMGRGQVSYLIEEAPPGSKITVAVGFPKGLVDAQAFWRWWLVSNFGFVLSLLIAAVAVVIGCIRWYVTEKYNKGRGVVVPRYEPPHDYPPAVAEVLMNESVSKRTWSATIVDLAVRGYVEIEEEQPTWWQKTLMAVLPDKWVGRDYRIKRAGNGGEGQLHPYEQDLLNILFYSGFNTGDDDAFSTRELRKAGKSKRTEFAKAIKNAKSKLLEDVGKITGAYVTEPVYDKFVGMTLVGLMFVGFFALQAFGAVTAMTGLSFQALLVIAALVFSCIGLYVFFKFEARLSEEGFIQREEWLGFKMYLETAEKYRLADLTPETFQKYLPYAIAFEVEDTWAKAFESFSMSEPNWYHGSAGMVGASAGSGMGSFSPSGFSTSFASSFSSSFSSSGGGGVSGGGGSAGGGAGGGGGGAF
ncbi:MAG: DUF2207 domain-containing protein [Candidatus Paceibacterota bacterium]